MKLPSYPILSYSILSSTWKCLQSMPSHHTLTSLSHKTSSTHVTARQGPPTPLGCYTNMIITRTLLFIHLVLWVMLYAIWLIERRIHDTSEAQQTCRTNRLEPQTKAPILWAAHEIALFAPWLAPAPCVPKASKRQPKQMAALTVMPGHRDCSDRSGPWDLSLRFVFCMLDSPLQ